MATEPPKPTPAELELLQALWPLGSATVRQAHEALQATRPDLGQGAVLRLMQVMHAKGLLIRDDSQRSHVYAPAQPRDALQTSLLKDLLQRAFADAHSRDQLIKAVKAAALFSRTGLYDVHFTYEPSEGTLKLSATDSQVGEQEAVLTPTEIKGDQNTITLNYRYLLDGLNAMDLSEVKLQVIEANAPCLITPQAATADYLYLVMPIKV